MNSIKDTIKLVDGNKIPRLGLGTFQMTPADIMNAILNAIETGYRHIDTAEMYKNEKFIGEALQKSPVPRNELYITSKVWPAHFDYNQTRQACEDSLKRLNTDYLDLYLLHWPGDRDIEAWKALIDLQKQGKCRSIGLSNFSRMQIEILVEETGVLPAANQVEFHPFNFKKSLLEYCRSQDIIMEAYSPLTRGKRLDDPTVQSIATAHHTSAAQVLIRWVLQHDVVVLPKSSNPQRIKENADVFDFTLSKEEMKNLNERDEGYSAL
ncbi:MAG: aldo/keto reductase [candidate division KSB1 bacterium]|nr:aldo/keto reductase [candidate division KSB1 bacterium]